MHAPLSRNAAAGLGLNIEAPQILLGEKSTYQDQDSEQWLPHHSPGEIQRKIICCHLICLASASSKASWSLDGQRCHGQEVKYPEGTQCKVLTHTQACILLITPSAVRSPFIAWV